jgi:AcrR family transcriptional regulator
LTLCFCPPRGRDVFNAHSSEVGLRERKKRQTRATIRQTALKLFLEKGYDSTTTSEIARAADLSIATLFNYFPSKESLLGDDFEPVFIHYLQARPASEPLFAAFREAMRESMTKASDEIAFSLARGRLIRSTPALQAAAGLERERDTSRLAELLAERYGLNCQEFELRVVSATLVSAMHVAYEAWFAADGKTNIHELVGRALAVVEAGINHPLNLGQSSSSARSPQKSPVGRRRKSDSSADLK